MLNDAYGPVTIGAGTLVGEHCVLGFPRGTATAARRGRLAQAAKEVIFGLPERQISRA